MDFLNVETIKANDEIGSIIHQHILNQFCKEYILIGEDRTSLPAFYLEIAKQIKNFEIRNDDIWVVSYPKSGTTWTQEMVWMIANNVDFEKARTSLDTRFPFLESSGLFSIDRMNKQNSQPKSKSNLTSVDIIAALKGPRFIKTHMPFSLLPDQFKNQNKQPKVIYVLRNPKDTCVSLYHHGKLLETWDIDLETFSKLFMAEKPMYGSYWKHIGGYWNNRNSLNMLIINYEDMKVNLPGVIRKVARFLEKKLAEKDIELLAQHLSFKSMKNNKALNKAEYLEKLKTHNLLKENGSFFRNGMVGGYKQEMKIETIKEFDEWIRQNVHKYNLGHEINYFIN